MDYRARRDRIFRDFADGIDPWQDDFIAGKFNLVSAALHNYLPGLDYGQHERIFSDILMHQQLSTLEQECPEALEYLTCEDLDAFKWSLLRAGGTVVCTFHTGSYRIINQLLIKNNIPYTLVIASSVLKTQGAELQMIYGQLSGKGGPGNFDLIDAESPGAGLKMLRELKKGKNLVLYIDGNTGSGDEEGEKNNSCDIGFLAQRLSARKGIAFLAHVAKAPILTAVCYRPATDDIRLRFFDPVFPSAEERETFAHETTQGIYDRAAPVIANYPGQWEAWTYLHKSVNIVSPATIRKAIRPAAWKDSQLFTLNLPEYGIFSVEDEKFLFRKAGFESYNIDDRLYHLLHAFMLNPGPKSKLDENVFGELFENGVLVPCIS